ncbi:glutathione-disulfide reductase [Paraburkholderia solisilvae]|uniref:Glutathione amide reductase n=1 Tax=Paraburkholderia solisilvae TaxID=624376 RepID=A0A6J5DIS0_9BURK|nr:glutathione-disulfide reductase [Paraburkholderia solisilvae]CAB3754079.1 Glutathione amide reductase [Paraburkholderia solisilvae]
MPKFDFDLFVIGGGSGGVRAARLAAQRGVSTAIAEEHRFGGTCVVRGCVPKKLLVYASEFGHMADDARSYGWDAGTKRFDWRTLIENKDKEVDRLSAIYSRNVAIAGATVFESRAEVRGPHTVYLVSEDRTVTAERILIATGGRPFIPSIPGSEFAITSNEAFHLDTLPRKIVIAGAGYIGIEFACIFHGLGVEVHIVHRGTQFLPGFDHDLRDELIQTLLAQGIRITGDSEVGAIEKNDAGLALVTTNGMRIASDTVMFAMGRVPNTAGLGIDKLGIQCGPSGEVVIDDSYQSSVPGIYAIGDVTGRKSLTPLAIRDGIAFIEANYANNPGSSNLDAIPTAVFSQPEIGTVGYSEEAARERYGEVDIYKSRFRPLKNTLSGRAEHVLFKIVVDPVTDRVIGCHVLGPNAAEIVQVLAISLRLGVRKSDLDATVALHPTLAEELVTMREKWRPPVSQLMA